MAVDAQPATGSISDANGVLEPGETVQVDPSWKNTLTDPQTFTGIASNLSGPPGPTYTIDDNSADYGTVNAGATGDCNSATGDCYLMTVSGTRPAPHWDATFTEDLSSNSISKVRTLHVGESFPDVPTSHPFYGFIENLFHNGVTGGCANGNYCPDNAVTRAQMAVFLLKGKLGASRIPPPATGTVFNDVHVGDFAADWIEQLAGFQITGGCGNGNYCPDNPVTRAQMAAFLLKAEHGSAYMPPACTGVFGDVPCPSQFADWIEQLFAEGITGGCGDSNYCPDNPSTRGQMAVFLVKTFGLQLYGP
jgi:S-layer homology domain